MEIILLENVKSLGKQGEILKVSDGYGRSLISKNLCLEATSKNKNDLKLKKQHDDKLALERLEQAKQQAKVLEEKQVVLFIKTGEGGRLFGAVSSKEVAVAVKKQIGMEIDKKKLQMPEPIKTLGNHEVLVKLHPKVMAKLLVKVQEES